jgi:hypothetical protein
MIRQIEVADALEELRDMVAANAHPKLSESQLARLLSIAGPRKDTEDRAPSDEKWSSTYDLDAVAAEAWRQKAALVAGDFSFTDGGSRLDRAEVIKNCLLMAQEYTKKIASHGMPIAGLEEGREEEFPAPEGDV